MIFSDAERRYLVTQMLGRSSPSPSTT